jgi:DnaJ-class molecular chaperone
LLSGTDNPFADFGFGQSVPFASRLQRPGQKKMDPIYKDLLCSLEELFNGCTKKLAVTRKRLSDTGKRTDK